MSYFDKTHKTKIKKLEKLWNDISQLADLAKNYGIDDIFQDNGGKLLQQIIYMNLQNLPGREGNDAIDENGIEWEMKSANIKLVSGFSTHHHLNHIILKKYRSVPWLFSIYENINLIEIYVMTNKQLEPLFIKWEDQLSGNRIKKGKPVHAVLSINNPKIPITFVQKNGIKVYPYTKPPIDPSTLV